MNDNNQQKEETTQCKFGTELDAIKEVNEEDKEVNEEDKEAKEENIIYDDNSSLASLEEYNRLQNKIINRTGDFKISSYDDGSCKQAYSISDKIIFFKNVPQYYCFNDPYNNDLYNNYLYNNYLYNDYLYNNDDIVYNAFINVLDGASAKIISPSAEKQYQSLIKYLEKKLKDGEIEFELLFQILVLYHLDGPLLADPNNIKIMLNNINMLLKLIDDEKLIELIKKLIERGNNEAGEKYIENSLKEIFQFYLDNKNKFSDKTENFFNKLFCFVLFTNKLDIKVENIVLDEQNNMIHIDVMSRSLDNDESTIKDPLFDNYCFKANEQDLMYGVRGVYNKINKMFIEHYLNLLLKNNNENFLLENLKRYIITPSKIKRIIGKTIKNFYRYYSDSIDFLYKNGQNDLIKENIVQIFNYYMVIWRDYNLSLIKYLTQFNDNTDNKELKNKIDTLINIAIYNFTNINELTNSKKQQELSNIITNSIQHYTTLKDMNINNHYLEIDDDKDINFNSIEGLNKSLEEKISHTKYSDLKKDIFDEQKIKDLYLKDAFEAGWFQLLNINFYPVISDFNNKNQDLLNRLRNNNNIELQKCINTETKENQTNIKNHKCFERIDNCETNKRDKINYYYNNQVNQNEKEKLKTNNKEATIVKKKSKERINHEYLEIKNCKNSNNKETTMHKYKEEEQPFYNSNEDKNYIKNENINYISPDNKAYIKKQQNLLEQSFENTQTTKQDNNFNKKDNNKSRNEYVKSKNSDYKYKILKDINNHKCIEVKCCKNSNNNNYNNLNKTNNNNSRKNYTLQHN